MGKTPKVRDFAKLEALVNKKPWVRANLGGPFILVGLILLAIGAVGWGIFMSHNTGNVWAYIIIFVSGMACALVGFHDEDIQTAIRMYTRVIEGPSEALRARAALPISIRSIAVFPILLVGGPAVDYVVRQWGFVLPDWFVLIWAIPTSVSVIYLLRSILISVDRSDLGMIESYQRGKAELELTLKGEA
jgi:hypothetical protein